MEDFELMVRTCDDYLFFLAFKETFGEIYCAWLDATPQGLILTGGENVTFD